ncbi:hypothetical protein NT05HA_0802 [Aggregatibacter aphrophilus NJ8700]|nr:hypothetical protein NT05HA_0802 [Aggregatibacter aphrophilus NJ8700]
MSTTEPGLSTNSIFFSKTLSKFTALFLTMSNKHCHFFL